MVDHCVLLGSPVAPVVLDPGFSDGCQEKVFLSADHQENLVQNLVLGELPVHSISAVGGEELHVRGGDHLRLRAFGADSQGHLVHMVSPSPPHFDLESPPDGSDGVVKQSHLDLVVDNWFGVFF